MLLSNLMLLFLAFVATVRCEDDTPSLVWPEKYSFEITKYYILAGFEETINVWKTKDQSKVEYNGGAVQEIVTPYVNKKNRGYRYEIHPESSNGESKFVCEAKRRSRWDEGPTDLLPNPDDFDAVGKEPMKDQQCTKFYKKTKEEFTKTIETLWAYYDDAANIWVPTRYEKEEFDTWLGKSNIRDIWDFESYNTDFDEEEVFNTGDLCSDSIKDPIKEDDEAVTKHLHFIDPENDDHVYHAFKIFKANYNKKYAHEKERAMRKSIFKQNLKLVKATNRKNLGYKLSVNQFADRTPEEIRRHKGLLRRPEGAGGTYPFPYTKETLKNAVSTLPSEYDLRLLGIIGPVLNQETCGSCWTFGTTAAVEGALARKIGRLITLSNQALIDCAWDYGSSGCNGGTDDAAYKFMMKYGMPTLAEYGTYMNEDGFCLINNMTTTYKISGYVDVTPNSIEALKVALVNNGPLSVSVHASNRFLLYDGGVFYDFSCHSDPQHLNHEITLVGYGEQDGETFWIVKNSWGQDWGINGYMHIAAKDNNCGIMVEPTYVII